MTSIPANKNDLSPDWFTKTLNLPNNNRVETVKLEPLGEEDSMSGYIYRTKLHYSSNTNETPKSLVIKLPRSRENRTPFLKQSYIREVRFYQQLAQKAGIPVPRLIHADLDTQTSDYILVLEDFPDSTNVRNETGATLSQAIKLIENMASLHSKHWQSTILSRYKFLNTFENIIEMFSTTLPNATPVFLSRFKQYLKPDEISTIQTLEEHFIEIVSPLFDSPRTLLHNDYAMKNILINKDETVFILVDWANVGTGPSVRDLSFFIGTSIPSEIRVDYEGDLIRSYWKSLVRFGVSGFSMDRLMDDYRRAMVIDLARYVGFGGREFFNSVIDSIVKQDVKKIAESVTKLDIKSLL